MPGVIPLSGDPGETKSVTLGDSPQVLSELGINPAKDGSPLGVHVSIETNDARWGFGGVNGHVLAAGSDLKINATFDVLNRLTLYNATAGSNATAVITVWY